MENKEILQLISILLQYPNEEIVSLNQDDMDDFNIDHEQINNRLMSFIQYLNTYSLSELTEKYVHTFDFNEKHNLYITYSKIKEEKERGQILVELKQLYKKAGLTLESDELPDYFPLIIEFMSIADLTLTKPLIEQFRPAILELKEALKQIESPYENLITVYLLVTDPWISE